MVAVEVKEIGILLIQEIVEVVVYLNLQLDLKVLMHGLQMNQMIYEMKIVHMYGVSVIELEIQMV
eukprot:CAMPEP_0201574370 /NCGR_PEP_ID=MMETSP0190_2-20130828/18807_1 /ASSEMBLY_ACC=CAM_ASM_000263 /TAXON_ID=37353 /ORGANISM="Rosalina sp." /LENGTH=64 /DNA_ID=CAMNT_0048002521 /DNA_START=329 /DNA_END=523 /DNA_ORIENTATION=-